MNLTFNFIVCSHSKAKRSTIQVNLSPIAQNAKLRVLDLPPLKIKKQNKMNVIGVYFEPRQWA